MKIAVIGTGKTGSAVIELLHEKQIIGPFNTGNSPTVNALQKADCCIIFVPGSAVSDILETVFEAGVPAVWGSTGFDWSQENLHKRLKKKNNKWLRASNFSLGMNIARRCLQTIGQDAKILDNPQFHIHEIHHTKKKDAPSGTALSWREWLGRDAEITSERKDDIKGIHELQMKTLFEDIQLKHEAKDRAVFAEGALWAARQLVSESVAPGFYTMEEMFDRTLANKKGI